MIPTINVLETMPLSIRGPLLCFFLLSNNVSFGQLQRRGLSESECLAGYDGNGIVQSPSIFQFISSVRPQKGSQETPTSVTSVQLVSCLMPTERLSERLILDLFQLRAARRRDCHARSPVFGTGLRGGAQVFGAESERQISYWKMLEASPATGGDCGCLGFPATGHAARCWKEEGRRLTCLTRGTWRN